MRALLPLLLLAACGDDGGSSITADAPSGDVDAATSGDAGTDAPPAGTMTLTSTAYAEGGVIPSAQACVGKGGMNKSPPLAFGGAPAGTQSFAVVLTDKTNNLVHSAIYDIPAATLALPADVDKVYAPPDVAGAHQTASYSGLRGYDGPCPPNTHTYQLKLYALSTATVPGATMATTKEQLVTLLATNLGSATLTATFTPPAQASSNSLQNAASVGGSPVTGSGASSGQRR